MNLLVLGQKVSDLVPWAQGGHATLGSTPCLERFRPGWLEHKSSFINNLLVQRPS